MGSSEGRDVKAKGEDQAAIVLGGKRPVWTTRGLVLTIILVEDGRAVIQHFIVLLSHQLALAVVE